MLVCKVENKRDAIHDDGIWCFVDSMAEATFSVGLLDSRANADFLVCYVDSRGEAGWRTEHPLRGKLS